MQALKSCVPAYERKALSPLNDGEAPSGSLALFTVSLLSSCISLVYSCRVCATLGASLGFVSVPFWVVGYGYYFLSLCLDFPSRPALDCTTSVDAILSDPSFLLVYRPIPEATVSCLGYIGSSGQVKLLTAHTRNRGFLDRTSMSLD